MGRRRKGEAPQMRHHKPSGLAYVCIGREQKYFGKWDSAEAKRNYRDFIRQWAIETPAEPVKLTGRPSVAEVVSAFTDYTETRYVRKDGSQTDEVRAFRNALAPLLTAHADRVADDVDASDLEVILRAWQKKKFTRKYINKNLGRVKRFFKWAAKPVRGYVSQETAGLLQMVDPLGIGEARDNDEVQPVPLRDLAATLKYLDKKRPLIAAMIRLGYYCGARPGEICRMRGAEIFTRSFRVEGKTITIPEGLAVFVPDQHKTAKRGQTVYYTLGPRAQRAIAKWCSGNGYLFRIGRQRDYIDENRYATIISEAATAAGVEHWSPNRLRHNFATRWDVLAGVEAAAAALRHKHISTTAIYVQRDLKKVGELAAKIG